MAQRMKKAEVTTTAPSTENKQPTANDMREWYEKNKKHIENFASSERMLTLNAPVFSIISVV